jgi:hypothetical protein
MDYEELIGYLVAGKAPADKIVEYVYNAYPFKEKAVPKEVVSASVKAEIQKVYGSGNGKRPSIAAQLDEYVTFVTTGAEKSQSVTFSLRDCNMSLGLKDPKEMNALRVAVKRKVEKNELEPVGHKSGMYRVIHDEDKPIDLGDLTDLKEELPITLPLGVHRWIKPMPHTVFIIAGEPDSGKSGFLLNFAQMNHEKNTVHYHSSEMGKSEFIDRTQYFWPDVGQCKTVRFYERSNDFASAIKRSPNDIHIIDYLQLFDNFYLMAEHIDKMARALKDGIVFIAIQKPKGREEGIGGERTKDLARLYLSLSPGCLKIVKAKNWRDPKENPNGMRITFKLAEGCKFVPTSNWEK